MSYIAPNTDIILLHNCPLENSYEHTIYFASATAQYDYFYSLRKYVFSSQSYQRYTKGSLRIMQLADNLYDCNYLMFKNTSFGNKWFYAFITGVEYVSNTVSEVFYEIDVMQTWAFNYTLGQCMVEREHSATDNVGDNILEENLETGDYFTDSAVIPASTWQMKIVAATSVIPDPDNPSSIVDVSGYYYGNTYSGINFLYWDLNSSGASGCNSFIEKLTSEGKSDAIISIFLAPAFSLSATQSAPNNVSQAISTNFTSRFGTYLPKNKKLYTYPYNFIAVTNNMGDSAIYRFEYFALDDYEQPTFNIYASLSCTPESICVPLEYLGQGANFDESLFLKGYPICAWTVDTFKAWLAQNAGALTAQGISAGLDLSLGMHKFAQGVALSTAGAVATGGASLALSSMGMGSQSQGQREAARGLKETAALLGTVRDHYVLPPQAKNNGSNSVIQALNRQAFTFQVKKIGERYAKIVDDYFTMYGYASHQLKVPNTHVRPHWTYTKTVECAVTGSVPANDLNTIKNVFNNGITFWMSGSEIGNYSLDNSPT